MDLSKHQGGRTHVLTQQSKTLALYKTRMIHEFIVASRSKGFIVFLVLYVDDILIMGSNIEMLKSMKEWLSSKFSMKDLGDASYILGVKIYRDRSKQMLGLSQAKYIDTVLKRFSMVNSKGGMIPTNHGMELSKEMSPKTDLEREHMKKIPFASDSRIYHVFHDMY